MWQLLLSVSLSHIHAIRTQHAHMNLRLHMQNEHGIQYIEYGVATISRLLKIIGLFCRISSLLYGSFSKETYNFKEPTSRSHPILGRRGDSLSVHFSRTHNTQPTQHTHTTHTLQMLNEHGIQRHESGVLCVCVCVCATQRELPLERRQLSLCLSLPHTHKTHTRHTQTHTHTHYTHTADAKGARHST